MVALKESDKKKIIDKALSIPINNWREYANDGYITNVSNKFRIHISLNKDAVVILRIVPDVANEFLICFELDELRNLYTKIGSRFVDFRRRQRKYINEFLESI